ncbi:MAG: hypothetical protein JSS02_31110 [Planctomycetes bacterium]|nr:hypothetical protein [Planctomycetota bacterium]
MLLREQYGDPPEAGPVGTWSTLVRTVLQHGPAKGKRGTGNWIADCPLTDPAETYRLGADRLAEVLESQRFPAGKAGLLWTLARWWQKSVDPTGEADSQAIVQIFADRSLEWWQEQLRALPGVNWELADRILLRVGGRTVYPLDRGSLRIAARHGWIDVTADYDECQSFFRRVEGDARAILQVLSQWQGAVAKEFCKKVPQCEGCPLQTLLPARGVISLDDAGD